MDDTSSLHDRKYSSSPSPFSSQNDLQENHLAVVECLAKAEHDFWLPETTGNNSLRGVGGNTAAEMDRKYAAYSRNDVYGTMGMGSVSLQEKLLLALALVTIVPIKLMLLLAIIIAYYLLCRLLTLFPDNRRLKHERTGKDESSSLSDHKDECIQGNGGLSFACVRRNYFQTENNKSIMRHKTHNNHVSNLSGARRRIIIRTGRFLSRVVLFILGFYWIKVSHRSVPKASEGKQVLEKTQSQPLLIVSNHVSYIDILYYMSESFPSFVAKRSVTKIPLVGLISECLGCIYVQREDKSAEVKGVSGVIVERIQAGQRDKNASSILFFPEGTTTNGAYLLPFKTGAFIAQIPIQPTVLKYPYKRLSLAWDTISGVRHVILLLCQFINYLEVEKLPQYIPSEEEKQNVQLYANNVRKFMAKEAGLILSDLGLHEKRIYQAFLNGMKAQCKMD